MTETEDREEFERTMDQVALRVRTEVISIIPQSLLLDARTWVETCGSDETLELERDANADAVDNLIRNILPGADPPVDFTKVSPVTVGLLLDRLLLLPQFLKWIPPQSDELTAGGILYAWCVIVYRKWREERTR